MSGSPTALCLVFNLTRKEVTWLAGLQGLLVTNSVAEGGK